MSAIPAEHQIVECRSCGARIFFARTQAMANSPLDAKPVRAIVVDDLGPGELQHKMRFINTFRSHFETCPNSKEHRRK